MQSDDESEANLGVTIEDAEVGIQLVSDIDVRVDARTIDSPSTRCTSPIAPSFSNISGMHDVHVHVQLRTIVETTFTINL